MAGTRDWVCSRFYHGTTKGLSDILMEKVEQVRRLQNHGLYPLPGFAAFLLFWFWLFFWVSRNRSERAKGWFMIGLWISSAIGFAAGLIPSK